LTTGSTSDSYRLREKKKAGMLEKQRARKEDDAKKEPVKT
jgi:hypothetical protein